MSTQKLMLADSWDQENRIIETEIKRIAASGRQLRILEAGCGQEWPLSLREVDYTLTGLDLDKDALEIRLNSKRDLHTAVVGDLRTAEFAEASFDVIYSAFVLEHIAGAETVLRNFKKWLRSGGIIVLRLPNPESVHGFITRVTPHWFHVLFYRHVLQLKNAGQPGYGPYPVHYDAVIWRKGIKRLRINNGLVILAENGDGYIKPGQGLVKVFVGLFKKVIKWLSLGRLDDSHTNLLYVIQKQ